MQRNDEYNKKRHLKQSNKKDLMKPGGIRVCSHSKQHSKHYMYSFIIYRQLEHI
jgi:hypothetical protein